MRFKIDWASLIVGRKFTVFALFYFVYEGNFQVQAPGRAYIWRGLFSEFYGTPIIQFVQMSWSFLSVGVVFVKHTLKFRKQYFFANLSFPRACNALDNSLNVTDFRLSNQTINI